MTAPTPIAQIPAAGAVGVPVSVIVQVTLPAPVSGGVATLSGPDGDVPGTARGTGTLRTFAPAAPLGYATTYTVRVAGWQDPTGAALSPVSWSFATAAAPPPGLSFHGDDAFPGDTSDDGVDYCLGGRLSFSQAHAVTQVRWWVPDGGRVPADAGVFRADDGSPVARGDVSGIVAPTGGGWVAIPLDAELVTEPGVSYVPTVLVAAQPRRYPAILDAFAGGPVTRNGITYETGVFAESGALVGPDAVFRFADYSVDVLARPVPAGTPGGEAGPPEVAVFGQTVPLRGTGHDDGAVAAWYWRQVDGPPVTLTGTGPTRTFTAPHVPGLLVFGLTVTDDDGNPSVEDRVLVAVHRNRTAAENLLPGTAKATWDVDGVGDPTILGYAWPYSVDAGRPVEFRVDGPAERLDVYRLGFYAGLGARLHARLDNAATAQPEPDAIPDSNGGAECTNWTTTATWAVPPGTVSGQFIAVVRGIDGGASHIPFVVRNDGRAADIVHKSADATWQAYNYYGGPGAGWFQGACLYGVGTGWGITVNRAFAVSWARPVVHRADRPQTFLFNAEYPAIRFLEEAGLDVQYIGCQDLDRSAGCLLGRRVFISSGHDEYWSQAMRDHAAQARDGGVHLVFWSGNEMFWRTRWDAGDDPDRRVMWCYKDTMDGPFAGPDAPASHVGGAPLDPVTWTGTFRDPRRPGGADPESDLTGTLFRMNGTSDRDPVIVAADYGDSPFWRHTGVAAGADLTLEGVIGHEADEVGPLDGSVVLLGETTENIDGLRADDAGQFYDGDGTMRWGIVLRRHASGTVTAGFGTVQWAWALSSVHDRQTPAPSHGARQATLNLLADMGAAAASVPAGLATPVPVGWDAYGFPDP